MFKILFVLFSILCIRFAIAQRSNGAAAYLDCQSHVTNTFIQQQFVPTLVNSPPFECLFVNYHGTINIDLGTIVTPTEVKVTPPYVYWVADPNSYYTLTMIDADEQSYKADTIWLVGNIPGANVYAGQILDAYLGIGPSRSDGYNRYVFVAYLQTTGLVNFTQSYVSSTNFTTRANTDLVGFANQYNLIPVAGNYLKAAYDDYTPILWAELGLPVSVAES